MLANGHFPTIVCEAGLSETLEDLKKDARLWLLHTGGETRIVIILSFKERLRKEVKLERMEVQAGTSMEEAGISVKQTSAEEKTVEEMLDEESILLSGLGKMTDVGVLANQLFELNTKGKLRQPLVGMLEAELFLYKACKRGDEIEECFYAKYFQHSPHSPHHLHHLHHLHYPHYLHHPHRLSTPRVQKNLLFA